MWKIVHKFGWVGYEYWNETHEKSKHGVGVVITNRYLCCQDSNLYLCNADNFSSTKLGVRMTQPKVHNSALVEYTYLPYLFFATLYTSLVVMLIYFRYKSTVVKLLALHSQQWIFLCILLHVGLHHIINMLHHNAIYILCNVSVFLNDEWICR